MAFDFQSLIKKLAGVNTEQPAPQTETVGGWQNKLRPNQTVINDVISSDQSGSNPFSGVQVNPQEAQPTVGSNPFSGVNLNQSVNPLNNDVDTSTRPRIVQNIQPTPGFNPDASMPVLSPVDKTNKKIEDIQNKEYSIKKDKDGNIISRGKDRDTDHNWWDVFKSAALGALQGYAATGNLGGAAGGAISGGIQGGVDRNADEKTLDRFKLGGLEQQRAKDQQQETYNQQRDLRKAQTNDIIRRPEKEQQQQQYKLDLEAQKSINRVNAIIEQRRLKGQDTRIVTSKDGSGKLVTVDGNGKETPFTDPDTGETLYNPLEKPVEREIEDGVNPDGSKRYTKVMVKGSQALSADAQKALAQAQLGWSATKYGADNDEQFDNDTRKWKTDIDNAGGELSKIDNETAGLMNKEAEINQNLTAAQGRLEALQTELGLIDADLDDRAYKAKEQDIRTAQAEVNRLATEKTNTSATLATKRGELSKAKQNYENLQKNPPKKPAKVTAPTLGNTSTFTEAEATRYYESKGKTPDEIKKLVAAGKANKTIQ